MKNQLVKLAVEAYETPVCSVVELFFEGVLCLSAQHEGVSEGEGGNIFDF